MVLARLLTPDAFGVISTIHMIISFAEIFTDAGFQKYIVQHQFYDEQDQEESVNVAFWSNFTVSLFIWAIIALFCNPLAELVGNPGLGYVIVIACIAIPLASFSSIQMALYRRNLDFKTLFKVKIVGILIPLVITIPLALFLRSFWALLIGILAKDVANAFILTYY
jgi:PST family polysaccharide transporter